MGDAESRSDGGVNLPADDVTDLHTSPLPVKPDLVTRTSFGPAAAQASPDQPTRTSFGPATPQASASSPGPQPHIAAAVSTPHAPGRDASTSVPLHLILPPRPTTLAEADLDIVLLEELSLKHIVAAGVITGGELAQRLYLPFGDVVEVAVSALRREGLVDQLGGGNPVLGAAGVKLRATERGTSIERAAREQSGYIGPAPVSLRAYERMLRSVARAGRAIKREDVWRRMAHLVLPDAVIDRLGAGLDSGGPIFLHGHPGNGKTSIGASIARMFTGGVLVPRAIAIDGHIVRVFDSAVHQPLPVDTNTGGSRLDDRWVYCQVPFVRAGTELQLRHLDLHFNEQHRLYDCPIQLKAAGGVLLLDDLGMQQCRVEDLLNRWLEPLATGVDYLTTVNGRRVAFPFTPLLVFATSGQPEELLSEAQLRRLPCKIEVPNPSEEHFRELFRRACQNSGVEFTQAGFEYTIDRCYAHVGRTPRSCHPAELIRLLSAAAHYYGVAPQLVPQLIDVAASLYFA